MSTRYCVTFTRIGRNHNVLPLVAAADDADQLADLIYRYAFPRLRSQDVDVVVDLDAMRGDILCGFQSGGSFTIEALADQPAQVSA